MSGPEPEDVAPAEDLAAHPAPDGDPEDTEPAPAPPPDPRRRRAWRLQVVLGAAALTLAWVGMPVGHVLTEVRPLRYIEGSPWTLGLAGATLVAGWLLTATPEPRPAGPHVVGARFLRILAALATGMAALSWWIGADAFVVAFVGWLAFPVSLGLLALGFAYVGRLHRLNGDGRLANLADLAGVVLPLMWIASQLISGYPGPALWGPGLAAMALGGLTLAALVVTYATDRSPPPAAEPADG